MKFKTWMENVVTFDFDDTLTSGQPALSRPNQKNIDKLKDHIQKGDEVHIVSRRPKDAKDEIVQFAKKHDLSVKGIHTCGGDKGQTLHDLKCKTHYDNNPQSMEDSNEIFKGQWKGA